MSTPQEYRKRLEGLLRDRPATAVDLDAVRRALRAPVSLPPTFTPQYVPLEEAVPGAIVQVAERGQAYLITTVLSELEVRYRHVGENFCSAFDAGLPGRISRRCPGDCWAPEDLLFVDLETTGLGGGQMPLFLIGCMTCEDGELIVRQYLARHYGEEAAITHLFLECAGPKRLLVSFNGKSFDYPYLRARAAATAVPWTLDIPHFDLLHECRRAWKDTLPNCRLQTLEQCICGHPPRYGDIPGMLIPKAYHDFVHSANAAQLAQIIRHNMLDLATLAELMSRLPEEEKGS